MQYTLYSTVVYFVTYFDSQSNNSSMLILKLIIIAIVVAQQHTSAYKGDGSGFEFQVGERIISFTLVKIHGEFCH